MREEDESIDNVLEKSLKGREMARKRAIFFKTVDTFAGITRRRLWLKDSGPDGAANTDGHAINVPFNDPQAYQFVEHEIAHILFQSDSLARGKFVSEYTSKVVEVTAKAGVSIDSAKFSQQMSAMVNILEDHRINSLWGLLYPGSYMGMVEANKKDSEEHALPEADKSLLMYMLCVQSGIDPGTDRFKRFLPYFLEAFRKVERRGFGATLLASKWLVTQLVSELVRVKKKQSSPQAPQATSGYNPTACASPVGNGGGGNDASDPQDDTGWYPAPVQSDLQTRAQALKDLSDMSGEEDPFNDVKDPQFPSKKDLQDAEDLAKQMTGLDVNSQDKMEDFMGDSSDKMQEIVDAARNAMRQSMKEDDWVKKEAMAKVVFKDIKKATVPADSRDEDRTAIRRLRAQFFRVMGKTKSSLAEAGSEIDIPAYIEGLATNDWKPCFKHEVRGQGFKGVVLLDRSGSMMGSRTEQSERACRIISQATRFPFVDLAVWGFKSSTSGQVDIDRYDRMTDSFSSDENSVEGTTPLHIATRLGVRYLEQGNEAKHLFIITDGFPVYCRRDGKDYPTWQLMMYVRDEVLAARKNGIGVSCLFIGDGSGDCAHFDVTPKQMHFMFGHQKSWRMVTQERLGSDIVQLVSTGFVDFLRRG